VITVVKYAMTAFGVLQNTRGILPRDEQNSADCLVLGT